MDIFCETTLNNYFMSQAGLLIFAERLDKNGDSRKHTSEDVWKVGV